MPVHGIDDGNNKHAVYTAEEVLAILQQAIDSGSLQGIDPEKNPIVAAVRESHNNSNLTFWSGTEAEFNEMTGVTSELIGARIGSDGRLYLLTGDTTLGDTVEAARQAALEATEGMKREVISVTLLADGWSNAAPYTQTVGVAGMTADKDFLAPYVVPTGNESDDLAAQAALSCISGGSTDTDSVTFYCYDEKPTTTITVFMVDKGTKIEPGGYPIASKTAPGIMQVGDGLDVDENGKVSAQVIEEKPLMFHSIAASSATYIVEFPNGKNMIIDTGTLSQWSAIKAAIDELGITQFDYAVITHFHTDHHGNIQNLIDTYDFGACKWYVQMKPNYADHSAVIQDSENAYNGQISILTNNGFTPIVPVNDSYVVVDEENEIRLHFLNTDATIAENYYSRYTEYRDTQGVNFNDFSLIAEIIHKNVRILATGDIERPVEEQYASYLSKVNIMTAPHHGVNVDADRAFYYTTMPDYAICSYITDTDDWLLPQNRSFGYLKEVGSKLITARSSVPVNGLFSFESNGDDVSTSVLYSGLTEDIYNFGKLFAHIGSLRRATYETSATVTLEQMLRNMPWGSQVTTRWWTSYSTEYAQVYADLQTIIPQFTAPMFVEIKSFYKSYQIKVYDDKKEFIATADAGQTLNWAVRGSGMIAGSVTGQTNLLEIIEDAPTGQYMINSYTDTNGDSGVLPTSAAYLLSIDKTYAATAKITGVIRDTTHTGTSTARAVFGYVNTGSTPKIVWHKVNNAEATS